MPKKKPASPVVVQKTYTQKELAEKRERGEAKKPRKPPKKHKPHNYPLEHFSPDTCRIILSYLRAGNFFETSCRAAGVSGTRVREWLYRARKEQKAGIVSDLTLFLDEVDKTQAQAEGALLSSITRSSSKDWRAGAWILERKYPAQYAPHIRLTVEAELDRMFGLIQERCPEEVYRVVIEAITQSEEGVSGLGREPTEI